MGGQFALHTVLINHVRCFDREFYYRARWCSEQALEGSLFRAVIRVGAPLVHVVEFLEQRW